MQKINLDNKFSIKNAVLTNRNKFFLAAGLILLYACLESVFAYFINWFFDQLKTGDQSSWQNILAPLLSLLFIWFFQIFIQLGSDLLRSRLEIIYTKKVLNKIFIHLSKVEQTVLDSSNTGEIIAKTVEDSKIATKNFLYPIIRIFNAIATFASAVVVLSIIAWQPTLILIGVSIVIAIIIIVTSAKLETLNERTREESSKLWGTFFDAFKNIKFIKVNNLQEDYSNLVKTSVDRYQEKDYAAKKFNFYLSSIQQFMHMCSWGSTLVITVYFNINGILTIGGVVAFLMSSWLLRNPLIEATGAIQTLREVKVSFARLNTILGYRSVDLDKTIYNVKKPKLSFIDVEFSYDNKRNLLEKASFEFEYGKKYAIVGKTGSGKSTIFDILTGTYPTKQGKILIGEYELNPSTIYTARNAISIAYQTPFLLNDTIQKNIKILNPKISDKNLNEILKVTHVDQIIAKLPDGINSRVGENGVQLSGGERKRIQIAQALAKNAQIYMFDELTASLDQKTARLMMGSIKNYLKDKTVIFIEHRLNMIEDVDQIYEFKNKTLEKVSLLNITDR